MFKVHLNLSYQKASNIEKDQLPAEHIEIFPSDFDAQKVEALQEAVNQFNTTGDAVFHEVFSAFWNDRTFNFNLIYTFGVQAPYDAWTVSFDGKPLIYFNLSEWTVEEISKQGLAVVIHEATHALVAPFLIGFESADPIRVIDKIIFDEGLAHFLGFPGDRSTLLEMYPDKWIQSEAELTKAMDSLRSSKTTESEKKDLLIKANTGPFWKKYGAISGMFRAAKIYSILGSDGLIQVIQNQHLPRH